MRVDSLVEIVDPCAEVIDPGLHAVNPGTDGIRSKFRFPDIVVAFQKWCGAPGMFGCAPVKKFRCDVIVSVRVNRGCYMNPVAYNALYGMASAIYLRLYVFDDDAAAAFFRLQAIPPCRCPTDIP